MEFAAMVTAPCVFINARLTVIVAVNFCCVFGENVLFTFLAPDVSFVDTFITNAFAVSFYVVNIVATKKATTVCTIVIIVETTITYITDAFYVSSVIGSIVSVTIGAAEVLSAIVAIFADTFFSVFDIIHIIAALIFTTVCANFKVFIYAMFTVHFPIYFYGVFCDDFTAFGANQNVVVIFAAFFTVDVSVEEYLTAILTNTIF